MTDREVDGGRFLTDQDKKIIAEGETYLAEELRKAESYLAQRRAKGRVALLADHVGVSQGAGDELVAKLDGLLEGRSKEEIDDIVADLSGLIAKISQLSASQPVEVLPVSTVAPAIELSSPVLPAESSEAVLVDEQTVDDIQQSELAQVDEVSEHREEVVHDSTLGKPVLKYLARIIGDLDTTNLTTDDAEKIADFLMTLRGKMSHPRVGVAFPYKSALVYYFQNLDTAEIANNVQRDADVIRTSLTRLRNAIVDKNRPEDIARMFVEVFGNLSSVTKPERDTGLEKFDTSSPKGQALAGTQAEERVVEKPVTNNSAPVPKPPTRPMPTIAHQASLQNSPELKSLNLTEVLTGVLKIKDSRIIGTLKAFLSLDIKDADSITQAQKNKLAYAISSKLRAKYGKIDDVIRELHFSEAERVAFANILGWTRRADGQEQYVQPTLTALYIRPDGSQVNQDRSETVKSVQKKIAEALALQSSQASS